MGLATGPVVECAQKQIVVSKNKHLQGSKQRKLRKTKENGGKPSLFIPLIELALRGPSLVL